MARLLHTGCRRVQSKLGCCNIGSVNTYRICGSNVIAPKFVDLEIADHDDPFSASWRDSPLPSQKSGMVKRGHI